ncbi:hypothetical protein VNO78_16596 [Psophocarpus tetragonolobus]|uniref:Uncharacterized protein n=1 Tax=Psophocarpus tetragonolobus TaxID=3891 RepID=A0AAN9SMI1_PSOTE
MGCGISIPDAEDAFPNQRAKGRHRHVIVSPIIDKKKDFENEDDSDMALLHGNNNNNNNNNKDVVVVMKPLGGDKEVKDEGSDGERLKEKRVVERNNKEDEKVFEIGGREKHGSVYEKKCATKNVEDAHDDHDGSFIAGPASPSFREYCNDYACRDRRSSVGDSIDYDSMGSIKKGSEDDSIKKNRPKNEEHEKKERKGKGIRNVMNKGKTRGRRSFLNFVCYNASNESYVEDSVNK